MLSLKELQKEANKLIVNQHKAVEVISTLIYKHLIKLHGRDFGHHFTAPFSALVYGDTGCGKTFLVKTLAQLADIPFIEINSKSISQEGWSGKSFIELVKEGLVENGNPTGGIIFIDEVDKLCSHLATTSSDNLNFDIQSSILKYAEGMEIRNGTRFLNFNNFIFIFAGAFQDLKVEENKKVIGFKTVKEEELKPINYIEAFIDFGLLPELAGRITSFCKINTLENSDYLQLLKLDTFNLKMWVELLKKLDAEIKIDYNIEQSLIQSALERKLGARGLIQAVEEFVNNIINEYIDELDINKLSPLFCKKSK